MNSGTAESRKKYFVSMLKNSLMSQSSKMLLNQGTITSKTQNISFQISDDLVFIISKNNEF